MKKSIISRFKKLFFKGFVRDVDITPNGFINFLLSFTFSTIMIDFLYLTYLSFNPINFLSILGFATIITILLTIIFSGLIVDLIKDRMKLLIICAILALSGLILISLSSHFEVIGFSLMIFSTGLYLVDLLTILTHESTILNRGRLIGYSFFISLLATHIYITLTSRNLLGIIFITSIIFLLLLYVSLNYEYKETKERLTSSKKFRQILFTYPLLGYLGSFFVLGFVLGNAYPVELEIFIDPNIFIIVVSLFFFLVGTSLDNFGRKKSYTLSILILSSLIIFSGIFKELYSEVFLGIAIPIIFATLFTLTGDFSTERTTLKYRGRITGIFLLSVFGGFIGGIILKLILTGYYTSNPEIYWIPELINGINSILLIGLLVWIMPLSEILTSKEADWADSLKDLYIIYKNSTCLYAKNFNNSFQLTYIPPLNEDLISSGLKGVSDLISEITKEKRHIKIIDKEDSKIYFSYGKAVIVVLIATKILPVLFKKLELFTKAFEKKYYRELENYKGNVSPFYNSEELILKYFK